MFKSVKLYMHYISIVIKSMMQYKTSFFLTMTGQFLVSFNVFLGIFFMFERFNSVEGFTYNQVLMCFSFILLEFSLAEIFARGFDSFSSIVRNGEFDRISLTSRFFLSQTKGELLHFMYLSPFFFSIFYILLCLYCIFIQKC